MALQWRPGRTAPSTSGRLEWRSSGKQSPGLFADPPHSVKLAERPRGDVPLDVEKPDVPLLKQIMQPPPVLTPPDRRIEHEFARRLGHSNAHFPLAEHQRQVLAWLDAAAPGEVIAVNGRPGTGKTTMLLSAVAGLWVGAARRGEDPPIIVAAASNNQAVTNIIDAFGKDFAKGEGAFAGRWRWRLTLPQSPRHTEKRARPRSFLAGIGE